MMTERGRGENLIKSDVNDPYDRNEIASSISYQFERLILNL